MSTTQFDIVLPDLYTPEIEVTTHVGWVDLHNFAYFLGYEYHTEGRLSLRWKLDGDKNSVLAGRLVSYATVEFVGVSQVSISPRDPEIPASEDTALEHYQLVDRSDTGLQFSFEFVGGVTINVTAKSVVLSADPL